MNNLDIMADSLFLPLSIYASLSDIKSRAISTITEIILLLSGILMVCIRALNSVPDLLQTIANNAPPLLLLLVFSIFGKSGIGDLEYATSMALFYPGLHNVSTLQIFPSVFKSLKISASVVSISLLNAVLIAWLITIFKVMLRWLREHNFPIICAYINTLAISIVVPRTIILAPFISSFITRSNRSITNVPFIPLIFIGFLITRYANAILL